MTQFSTFKKEHKVLLSYHYIKNQNLEEKIKKYFIGDPPKIFIDSGAYSAFASGVTIDIKEYAAWIHKNKHMISVYSNLDSIGDAEQTWINQQRLEEAGLRPLPVFHTGEPWSYLERYIDRYPYIALGGMVPYLKDHKKLMPWLVKSFKMAGDRSVYHGFGCTNFAIIKALPWYSVDSTSWLSGVKFGGVSLFDMKKGSVITVNLGDYKSIYKFADLIREHGFNPEHFADRKLNNRNEICAINAVAYLRAEQYVRQIHGEIAMPHYHKSAAEFSMYLAGNILDFEKMLKGMNLYLSISYYDYRRAYNVINQKADADNN